MTHSIMAGSDPFMLGGQVFSSRLIMGTGGVPSMRVLQAVIAASGTAMCTVAMRRHAAGMQGSVLDILDRAGVRILPNTAGCRTADEAVRTAQLAREALGTMGQTRGRRRRADTASRPTGAAGSR